MKAKVIFSTLGILIAGSSSAVNAQDYTEEQSNIWSTPVFYNSRMKEVREINGGTVFRISYEGEWTPELKGAFEYAAKMVEEVIPPCLPVTLRARLADSGSGANVSKVSVASRDNFGAMFSSERSPMTEIKAIILGEYTINAVRQFADNITETDFFDNPAKPDIIVTINRSRLGEFSLATDSREHSKLDFVTIAARDILKGMGMISSLRANGNEIIYPSGCITPFESAVLGSIGQENMADAYRKATSGSVDFFKTPAGRTICLYAPAEWVNGVSLNYFVPDPEIPMSNIFSAKIGPGTIIRDIADPAFSKLFNDILNWRVFGTSSTSAVTASHEGSTANVIEYGGTVRANGGEVSKYTGDIQIPDSPGTSQPHEPNWVRTGIVREYCEKFHPYFNGIAVDASNPGWTVSALKKDGTWDCLYRSYYSDDDFSVDFADLEFHCDNSEYARSCDGHLRIRLTQAYWTMAVAARQTMAYRSLYYVMEYLPQKVSLGLAGDYNPARASDKVLLGLKDTEGATAVRIEVKRKGSRVPTTFTVEDIPSGIVELPAYPGSSATYTAVSVNDNGTVKGEPLTIEFD